MTKQNIQIAEVANGNTAGKCPRDVYVLAQLIFVTLSPSPVDICNLISISNVPIDKRTYPDSKRVDSVQCGSGRLRLDLSLADYC